MTRFNTFTTPNFLFQLETEGIKAFHQALSDVTSPFFIVTYFKATKKFMHMKLSPGGQTIRDLPNAGGHSVRSESLSFEVMKTIFGAEFLKAETEIEYQLITTKLTDFLVTFPNNPLPCVVNPETLEECKVAVSVTRAFHYLGNHYFTPEDALEILLKKLYGIRESSENVCERDRWSRQVLHIWCPSIEISQIIDVVYRYDVPPELKSNTIVVVTVAASESDRFLYTEGSMFLCENLVLNQNVITGMRT